MISIKVIKEEEILKEFPLTEVDKYGNYLAREAIQAAVDYADTVNADTVKLPGVAMRRDA